MLNARAVPVSAPAPPTATLGADVVPYEAWMTVSVTALTWGFNVMQHYRHLVLGNRMRFMTAAPEVEGPSNFGVRSEAAPTEGHMDELLASCVEQARK